MVYEYECIECGNTTEVQRKIDDMDAFTQCVKCGGNQVRRILSSSNFHLHGQTWARDGYSSPRRNGDHK